MIAGATPSVSSHGCAARKGFFGYATGKRPIFWRHDGFRPNIFAPSVYDDAAHSANHYIDRSRIMQKTQNLQDVFLNQLRRDRLSVTVFLMNGFQMHGIIRSFDGFTVVLDTDGKQQLIYKHAISTIIPPKPLSLEE